MSNDWREKYAAVRKRLESMMERAGLTVESVQVSTRPDFADEWHKSATHARFELKRNQVTIHTGYYSAGAAHSIPDDEKAFKALFNRLPFGKRHGVDVVELFKFARRQAHGKGGMTLWEEKALKPSLDSMRALWLPHAVDVVQSMLSDATGESFESWCGDLGYDTDSRKALATWEACRESDRVMRGVFGKAFDSAVDLAREF